MNPHDIRISFTSAPIPDSIWMASREGWEPGSLYGHGRTPIIALADLLEKEMEQELTSAKCSTPNPTPTKER